MQYQRVATTGDVLGIQLSRFSNSLRKLDHHVKFEPLLNIDEHCVSGLVSQVQVISSRASYQDTWG